MIKANGTAVGYVARREKEKVVAGGLNVEEVTALEAADAEDAAEDAAKDAPLLVPTMTEHGAVVVDVA
jgi:hypothetical protein